MSDFAIKLAKAVAIGLTSVQTGKHTAVSPLTDEIDLSVRYKRPCTECGPVYRPLQSKPFI